MIKQKSLWLKNENPYDDDCSVCLHAYLHSKKEKGFIQSIYKVHIQSPYTKSTQTKSIQSPWHIP